LQRQRERLDSIQNQFPREENKQESPLRQSEGLLTVSSPGNLEKAYEDLEREIREIKQKLQSSVQLVSSEGERTLTQSQPVGGDYRNQRQEYQPLRSKGSKGSPSGTRTIGGKTDNLDDQDYSLSVSDLNQSQGHSLGQSYGKG